MSPLMCLVCCVGVVVTSVSTAALDNEVQVVDVRSVDSELAELRNRLAALESIVKGRKVCPPDFIFVPSVTGCYKVLTKNLDWISAAFECRELHRDAHLVAIDNIAEQHAIHSTMTHHHNDITLRMCSKPYGDTVSLWTAGQRVDPSANTPFLWKILSADGMKMKVSHLAYSSWNSGEPNYHLSGESCLHITRSVQYRWNDAPCSMQTCSLCEIDLE